MTSVFANVAAAWDKAAIYSALRIIWLTVPQRLQYRSSPWWSIVVFNTGLQDISPTTVCLCLKFPVATRQHLRSARSRQHCLFNVFAGPTNSLQGIHCQSVRFSCLLRTF